ncbi:hypothetical protein [Nitritalea halalkaliphila]|nr:hypothetical protein [Nitritalea halalkaliphila]
MKEEAEKYDQEAAQYVVGQLYLPITSSYCLLTGPNTEANYKSNT